MVSENFMIFFFIVVFGIENALTRVSISDNKPIQFSLDQSKYGGEKDSLSLKLKEKNQVSRESSGNNNDLIHDNFGEYCIIL